MGKLNKNKLYQILEQNNKKKWIKLTYLVEKVKEGVTLGGEIRGLKSHPMKPGKSNTIWQATAAVCCYAPCTIHEVLFLLNLERFLHPRPFWFIMKKINPITGEIENKLVIPKMGILEVYQVTNFDKLLLDDLNVTTIWILERMEKYVGMVF